jgi:hypothetical protein
MERRCAGDGEGSEDARAEEVRPLMASRTVAETRSRGVAGRATARGGGGWGGLGAWRDSAAARTAMAEAAATVRAAEVTTAVVARAAETAAVTVAAACLEVGPRRRLLGVLAEL